jgi:hypothetical protein
MDRIIPFDTPCTLHDYLRRQAALLNRRRRRGRSSKKAAGRPAVEGPRELPLVPEMGLCFVVSSARGCRAPDPPPGKMGTRTAAVEEPFRRAFTNVWCRIAESDRRALLDYWHSRPRTGRSSRPMMRVVDGLPGFPADAVCDDLGHTLVFPASLVVGHAEDLRWVIARALATAMRYASRRHWQLIQERIEEPMGRWQRRRGRKVTEGECDAKRDQLEAAYLVKYEKELAQLLRSWGFAESGGSVEQAHQEGRERGEG